MRHEITMWAAMAAATLCLGGCMQRVQHAGEANGSTWPTKTLKTDYTLRAAQSDMDVAMALITELRYADAATLLEEVIAKTTPVAAAAVQRDRQTGYDQLLPAGRTDAMFWLGFCREKLGQTERAAEMYRAVIARGDQDQYVTQARQRLAELR